METRFNGTMVMNVYSAFSIDIFKCALQASDLHVWVRADINITVFFGNLFIFLTMDCNT